MERRKNIDESLTERHGILHLLEKLTRDDISLAEMEEIGVKLQKSGKRALSPLVRLLWREKNGDLISRYTYLLDFFDDDVWIDQLIQIALKRRDLDEEGTEALLDALEEYGIDVDGPPFSRLSARGSASLRTSLPKLLDKGEEGLVCCVEDILFFPQEARAELIRELPRVPDGRILTLLEILAGVGDREIRLEAVTALGRVRTGGSIQILSSLGKDADERVRCAAERSLRRLSFVGVETAVPRPGSRYLPFHAAYASPFDGTGCRTVWLARHTGNGLLALLCLQIDGTKGMRAAWGDAEIPLAEFDGYLEQTGCADDVVEVAPAYALTLLRDAIYRSGQGGALLPAEFYVWRLRLCPEEVEPEPYEPDFPGFNLSALAESARYLAGSESLFDDDYFAGWGVAKGRVCDYAEEMAELEKTADSVNRARGLESLVKKFCDELLAPELEQIRRRLVLTADLMNQAGTERELVATTLAAAMSLDAPRFRYRRHPFLRRLALASIDQAREALAEGYDLRLMAYDEDEWDA